jgi:hypothetical protein
MKFLSAGLLALTAPLAGAAAFSLFDPTQVSLKNDDPEFPVKGDNPLLYCADPASYRLDIQSVDLTPNPPVAYVTAHKCPLFLEQLTNLYVAIDRGRKLTIAAEGTLLDRVEKGAKVNLEVKYGLITLISQTVDLCEELKKVDLSCPLEKGKMVLTKEVELPKQIPPVRTP